MAIPWGELSDQCPQTAPLNKLPRADSLQQHRVQHVLCLGKIKYLSRRILVSKPTYPKKDFCNSERRGITMSSINLAHIVFLRLSQTVCAPCVVAHSYHDVLTFLSPSVVFSCGDALRLQPVLTGQQGWRDTWQWCLQEGCGQRSGFVSVPLHAIGRCTCSDVWTPPPQGEQMTKS